MNFILVFLAFLATVYAALPSNDYLPPLQDAAQLNTADLQTLVETSPLTDTGYRYKTIKRYRHRLRRDVNQLPVLNYLPPVSEAPLVADIPVAFDVPGDVQGSSVLADDGYHYKTVKRFRLRQRRDVNKVNPVDEYLPPVEEASTPIETPLQVAVAEEVAVGEPAQDQQSTVLAKDGYRYKTVKRFRLRHRRDVNELPSEEYLPAVEEAALATGTPIQQLAVPQESSAVLAVNVPSQSEDSTVLADDGYRYKTVKRFRLRHRRDVNELPSEEYLLPIEEVTLATRTRIQQNAVSQESDDGYRYSLPSNEYLPPGQEAPVIVTEAPIQNEAVDGAAQDHHSSLLKDDGYHYKTVKRYRLRHRRDVNKLPANEYLPPAEEASVVTEAPEQVVDVRASDVLAGGMQQGTGQESAMLTDDGYRYKTVRHVVYRNRL